VDDGQSPNTGHRNCHVQSLERGSVNLNISNFSTVDVLLKLYLL